MGRSEFGPLLLVFGALGIGVTMIGLAYTCIAMIERSNVNLVWGVLVAGSGLLFLLPGLIYERVKDASNKK